MYLSKQEFKEELAPIVEAFINGFVDVMYRKFEEKDVTNKESIIMLQERIMTAKEVCAYYGKISNSTLRRHEQNGLRRMPSLKNKNRMFRFTECERYFNQKK